MRLFRLRADRCAPARGMRLACALVATIAFGSRAAADSVVNFWISPVDQGPAAPILYAAPGEATELKVWARPANNYKLMAFSLNLVAEQEGLVTFDGVSVLNPAVGGGTLRHQLVFDSATGLFADPDGVRAFQGFSFFPGGPGLPNGAGIGPGCGLDPACGSASGAPSWQIATITYHPDNYGTTNLFLEIGTQGIWQSPAAAMEPDPPGDTIAVFGLPNDLVHRWDETPGPDLRNTHVGAADAVIRVATGDFDANGLVDGADFLRWQKGLGGGHLLGQGDSNNDAVVNAEDLAAWRFQFGATFAITVIGVSAAEPRGSLTIAATVWLATISWRRRMGVDSPLAAF